jgi:hypothetical protein
MRIVVFVGSPIEEDEKEVGLTLFHFGKNLEACLFSNNLLYFGYCIS